MRRVLSRAAVGAFVLPMIAVMHLPSTGGAAIPEAAVPAGSTLELQVTGRGGVPANASAVVLNLTAAGPAEAGFLTAWPCGASVPTASNLNYAPGRDVANSAVVKVGTAGKVCIYSSASTQIIADVNGYFPPASSYTSLSPARVLDTRPTGTTTDGAARALGTQPAGSTYELQVTGRGGVPANASAVVLNLTAAGPAEAGFLTAWPCGASVPTASNLNYAPGRDVANSAVVKVGTAGKVCIYSSASTQIIADVNGYFPPASSYTSLSPARVLDTRPTGTTTDGAARALGTQPAGSTYELQVTGRGGVPANASAVVLNLTAAGPAEAGFLTAWPCGENLPTASNLNYAPGSDVANSAVVKVGTAGKVCIYSSASTQLIADANGYFPPSSDFASLTPARLLDTRDAPPAAAVPSGAAFVETFTGGTGFERFRHGVFHRDTDVQGAGLGNGTWTGDHDVNCGLPVTQRTISKANRDAAFYNCRDHLMTSLGHVDSYSIAWFSPNQTFNGQTKVSWDVNVTDLLSRQWYEVMIVGANGPDVTCIDWLPCDVPHYPNDAVIVGNGPSSGVKVTTNATTRDTTWQPICGNYALDPEGCASKELRRPWSVTDNRNGTITVNYNGRTWTVPGSFPTGNWKVVFKSHNYTSDKDGQPVGHTWHWDNIIVS